MRTVLAVILIISACDVFRAGQPNAELSREQFVEVYVELARARTPTQRQAILKKHNTSEKALREFVEAYSGDVAELSLAFDSALARLAAPSSGHQPVPVPR